jgi:hypothetical protein
VILLISSSQVARIMVYITMLGHISSFLAEYLLFAFLIALARSSSLMWKRNSEGDCS